MSIYADYTHDILHHQSERELITAAEHRRMAHEAAGTRYTSPWWRRLFHAEQRHSIGGIGTTAAHAAR